MASPPRARSGRAAAAGGGDDAARRQARLLPPAGEALAGFTTGRGGCWSPATARRGGGGRGIGSARPGGLSASVPLVEAESAGYLRRLPTSSSGRRSARRGGWRCWRHRRRGCRWWRAWRRRRRCRRAWRERPAGGGGRCRGVRRGRRDCWTIRTAGMHGSGGARPRRRTPRICRPPAARWTPRCGRWQPPRQREARMTPGDVLRAAPAGDRPLSSGRRCWPAAWRRRGSMSRVVLGGRESDGVELRGLRPSVVAIRARRRWTFKVLLDEAGQAVDDAWRDIAPPACLRIRVAAAAAC